jgi:hypothetical protein
MRFRDVALIEAILRTGVNLWYNINFLELAFSEPLNRVELGRVLLPRIARNTRFKESPALRGHTPLTFAISIQDLELVKAVLIDHSTDQRSEHPDFFGKGPFQIAKELNNQMIKDLLRSRGLGDGASPRSGFEERKVPEGDGGARRGPFEDLIPSDELEALRKKVAEKSQLKPILDLLDKAKEKRDFWVLFGSPIKTKKALEGAYRDKIAIVHPDKNPKERSAAEQLSRMIHAIKDYLLSSAADDLEGERYEKPLRVRVREAPKVTKPDELD